MTKLMVYGAAGYTGRMAATNARNAGVELVLAGRVQDEAKFIALASELGVEYRLFAVDDLVAAQAALSDIGVLLNCAGPYMRTAEPLMRACIAAGVHYLDIAAELDSYQLAEKLDQAATVAGVMLLPGSGGSVAMLGSLAAHAAKRVTNPRSISIAMHVAGGFSRGSAVSASENLNTQLLHRVDGELVVRGPNGVRDFDFGNGPATSFPVTLPDLITIWRTTDIPNIETYVYLTDGAFPEGDLAAMPDGPTPDQREANRYHAAVEVTGEDGTVVRSVLETVNGYTFTTIAAAEAARRVLNGEVRPGFQTPTGLFGAGFAETIADTTIVDH
ncbi:saccharopine dehydrogenase family protein [Kaistia terrae]|uniref:Saccharopine dehydrogenase family protein n=1 Tax=Kaistia terrae TaxID=537017 RepID=A0ABW0PNM5_9HYPH|nr:saccharopine dehydrogenase NADP-binding domain-containing protein [Kaistia terrae]MCX5580079.1 saccharopine dehydrogenase NADP-binding domain-containing protein [Kaistia terrae]